MYLGDLTLASLGPSNINIMAFQQETGLPEKILQFAVVKDVFKMTIMQEMFVIFGQSHGTLHLFLKQEL